MYYSRLLKYVTNLGNKSVLNVTKQVKPKNMFDLALTLALKMTGLHINSARYVMENVPIYF